ncbi:Endoplasmic reticulum mannosyl-oligosaccharide 1,2-alpha-mannosidase [Beauveria bassiana D1-5]|uniref:alpha-1,2-Mannosidase n=1 Tax=Beauveria bassiana D1-5 TaxID=1245745 RepID=A0A0A2VQ17_BEABA|nr:Endoplasmic reticulum mannosyl-oligosaccharide 1,2-alpha-mannosidase [Beauveria bassiana D1-5]
MAIPRRASRLLLLTGAALLVFLIVRLLPSHGGGYVASRVIPQRPKIFEGFDPVNPKQFHPAASIKALPTGTPRTLPRVQAPDSAFKQTPETEKRRQAVRKTFERSFGAYKKYAWMQDEVTPVTARGKDTFGGWAATLVDSLDTLWIMDFKEEFKQAAEAASHLDWGHTDSNAINIFETTIRHLGGLLSAPLCVARLSQLTGDPKYYDATDRVTRFLERVQNDTLLPGMWPTVLDFQHEEARDSQFTLGALADSLYEYLPKMNALLGGVDDTYERLFRAAMNAAEPNLLFRPALPGGEDILFAGDYQATAATKLVPRSQHLTCFAGGMFGLGGRLFANETQVAIGEKLARGCGYAYAAFPTGVMPEIFTMMACERRDLCAWDEQAWAKHGDDKLPRGFVNAWDPRYLLRPEAIESIFILYRITANADLQDLAWQMFEAIMKSTTTQYANSAIADVRAEQETSKLDSMEPFTREA